MFGYHGRALVVDLSRRQSRWEPLPEDVLRRFIGGVGLGTYLLHRFSPPGVDPLSPENPLIFAGSPLIGTRLTTSSKFAVVTKSPLTGCIGDSLSSSFLATELKNSGMDALVITGQSSSPLLLFIDDGEASFLDATFLCGLSTSETESTVKESLKDKRVRVASIGVAGEQGVLYAGIRSDGGRLAGRAGPGAVMGAKQLKALAIRGNYVVGVAAADQLSRYGKDLSKRSLGSATEKYRELGTMANVLVFNRLQTLPTRNFRHGSFAGAERLSGERLYEDYLSKHAHCANCTIGCEKILSITDESGEISGRMEYESLFALGPLCGIDDPAVVLRATHFCDEAGMDTISSGVTIAWAMECFERGILDKSHTGGLDLRFGNGQALLDCLELIACRKGIGDLLANGTRKASQIIGQGSDEWAMHVKGLELPGYEPRSLKTLALGLAVSTRGACHNRSSAYEADFSSRVNRFKADKKRGVIVVEGEDFAALLDSLIWCKFLRGAFREFWEESAWVYEMVTGWPMTAQELRQAGERITNAKKLFNIREGWVRSDDNLPPRVLTEDLPEVEGDGGSLTAHDLEMMVRSYYEARGWTQDGHIPEAKLKELDLIDLVVWANPVDSLKREGFPSS